MFGFPIGNGNAGFNDFVEKFTNNADSGFPKIQQREVFYSIKDGNWFDPTMWQTASGRVGLLPTANDDIYIRHNLTTNTSFTFNNVFVTGTLTLPASSAISYTVNGNFKCYGRLVMGDNQTLFFRGNDNVISNYSLSLASAIHYSGTVDQEIIPISYSRLFATNGRKFVNYNLEILDQLQVNLCSFYINCSSFIVNGTSNIMTAGFGTLYCLVDGASILFKGLVQIGNSSFGNAIDFSGNPNVEFRGGLTFTQQSLAPQFGISGTGTWSFTTNNQTLTDNGNGVFNCKILIGTGVTLTIAQTGINTLNDTINGVDGTSKLLMGTNGIIYFGTQLSAQNSMTTGIWDFTTNANTIGYVGNYSATIPSYFTNFHNLTISGTGTKTLSTNTTLNGNLSVSTGTFEMSTYNLVVTGTTTNNVGTISKNASGNITFIGNYTTPNTNGCIVSFTGNPSVECRNGFYLGNNFGTCNAGTGTWSFTTNNQDIRTGGTTATFNNIIIGNDITLNIANSGGGAQDTTSYPISITNSINGSNANSKFVNKYVTYIGSSTIVMTTGILDILSFTNQIAYGFNGNFTIPYTNYHTLGIGGTGTKTLSSNTTLNGNLALSQGNLELSTYNLTVNGNTSQVISSISKNGAGNILFVGSYTISNNGGSSISFTGNPTIEFRNGFNLGNNTQTINTGTGQISFTTNNQSLSSTSATTYTFDNNILISGAITLTLSSASTQSHILKGTINGNNAGSKLLMAASSTLNYQSATQPMVTGILDTSTNLNTWIYGSGNQDIKGSPTTSPKQVYRNLTLNGGGVKTLQGYVSVQNTYTLTSPATLALNGFTLTNP